MIPIKYEKSFVPRHIKSDKGLSSYLIPVPFVTNLAAVLVSCQVMGSAPYGVYNQMEQLLTYSWFSHDVTKIQTKELSLPLSFYYHVILEHLKTFIQTNFRLKRVLCFPIQDA